MSYIAERRQEEKERRRGEILEAAEAVAGEVGWDATTMDEVARRARLSRALLYVYFQDKTDLLYGIAARAVAVLKQRFDEGVARHVRGLKQMQEIGRAYVAYSREFPMYFEVLSRCELLPSPSDADPDSNAGACARAGEAVLALMVGTLERGMRDGSIRGDLGPPHAVALVLKGFMHGVIQMTQTQTGMLARSGVDHQTLLAEALTLATRALSAPPR
jgi:AcrR family transcriptional regulator